MPEGGEQCWHSLTTLQHLFWLPYHDHCHGLWKQDRRGALLTLLLSADGEEAVKKDFLIRPNSVTLQPVVSEVNLQILHCFLKLARLGNPFNLYHNLKIEVQDLKKTNIYTHLGGCSPCRLYSKNWVIKHSWSFSSPLHSKQIAVTVSLRLSALPLQGTLELWAVEGTGGAGSGSG